MSPVQLLRPCERPKERTRTSARAISLGSWRHCQVYVIRMGASLARMRSKSFSNPIEYTKSHQDLHGLICFSSTKWPGLCHSHRRLCGHCFHRRGLGVSRPCRRASEARSAAPDSSRGVESPGDPRRSWACAPPRPKSRLHDISCNRHVVR